MVVRFFEDNNITHVEGKIDPLSDIETIETELQLADISTVEKRLFSVEKEMRSGSKESKLIHSGLQKIKDVLYEGKNARSAKLDDLEKEALKGLQLMTQKPILYIANVSEDELAHFEEIQERPGFKNIELIPISARIESELNELSDEEKKEYLETLGVDDTGLNHLIKKAYETLGLITYFTSGEPETRAWTIKKGFKAPEAAGVIHTDFEKGFIAAEVIPWQDLFAQGGWPEARSKGLVRTEGKTYVMQDGDVCLFRFNV
jgi:GTP-binding protein YchF